MQQTIKTNNIFIMAKTINNASSAKNSNAEAQKEIMVNNVLNYLTNEMVLDGELDDFEIEIDEEYGLLEITNHFNNWKVNISFDGTLFEFKPVDNDFYLDENWLEEMTQVSYERKSIIEAMFECVEEAA